jgi:hypothetical protein
MITVIHFLILTLHQHGKTVGAGLTTVDLTGAGVGEEVVFGSLIVVPSNTGSQGLYSPLEPLLTSILFHLRTGHPYILLSLTVLSVVIFVFALIVMITFTSLLWLSEKYKRGPQIPFNIFLDRILPIITLLTPSCAIICLNPFSNLIHSFLTIILIHTCILLPLFHFWAQFRDWNTSPTLFLDWSHPKLYKYLSLTLLYPAIWGLYFSLSRYFRLGQSYTPNWSSIDPEILGIILASFPFVLLLLFSLVVLPINRFRTYLWYSSYPLLTSIHLNLLRFNWYTNIYTFLSKIHWVLFVLITQNSDVYITPNPQIKAFWFQKITRYFYFHPLLFSHLSPLSFA